MSEWAGPGTLKNFIVPRVKAPYGMKKIWEQSLFTMLTSRDIAFCLHFRANYKMAARGLKMVAGKVYLLCLITKNCF